MVFSATQFGVEHAACNIVISARMSESYIDLLQDPDYFVAALLMFALWFSRLIVLPALISGILVSTSITLSHYYNVLAHPSDRGSHSIATPRLGGLGGAAAFYITCLLMPHWDVHTPLEPWRLVLLIGGAWALVGGALDDFQELPPRWKLLVQIGACGCVVAFGFVPAILDLPFWDTIRLSPLTGSIIAILVTFFMMNIFNFMDGMDGQASVFGMVTAIGLAGWLANHGFSRGFGISWTNMYLAGMAAVIFGSLIGVLFFNLPGRDVKKKTFLGDCGSQFYGFVLAVIALQAGDGPGDSRFPWIASLILFSPFIYDVVYTLIRRIRRHEDLTQAHRSHLYQRLMVAGWSHGKTLWVNLLLYITAMLLSWAYASQQGQGFQQVSVLLLLGIVLTVYTLFVIEVEKRVPPKFRTKPTA